MKFNIANPTTGCQKKLEIDYVQKLREFYDKKISKEVPDKEVPGDGLSINSFSPPGPSQIGGLASRKDTDTDTSLKKLFPASSEGIQYFYMIYDHFEKEDPCSFDCVAMNKSTGEATHLTISPSPDNTEKPHSIFLNFTAVAVGPTIYMIGGHCRNGFCPADVETICHRHAEVLFFDSLQPEKGWTSAASMHIPRRKPAAVVIDGKIYVFGGSEGYDDGECFDPKTNRWARFPAAGFLPKNACIQAPYLGCHVLVRCEYQDDETLRMYLLDEKKWETVCHDFAKCSRPGAIVGDIIYAVLDDEEERPLQGYHLVRKQWFPVDLPPEIKIHSQTAWVFASGSADDRLCLVWYHFEKRSVGGRDDRYECVELKLNQSNRRRDTTTTGGGSSDHELLLNLTATKVTNTCFPVQYITDRISILAL